MTLMVVPWALCGKVRWVWICLQAKRPCTHSLLRLGLRLSGKNYEELDKSIHLGELEMGHGLHKLKQIIDRFIHPTGSGP